MQPNEESIPLVGLKGLDRSLVFGDAGAGLTRSLLNVHVRDDTVQGRGGVTFNVFFGIAMSENIAGFALYTDTSLNQTLLRIGATKVESSAPSVNGGIWADITGTALSGAATDRVQWADFRNVLYFTNEGGDRLRRWAGTGNTAAAATNTAPFCKAVMSYYGFFFALNTSDDGTTFTQRRALYTETPDIDWSTCEGNELNFNETPGAIMAAHPHGRSAIVFKEDGLIHLRWIGGPIRFAQELIRFDKGTIAPLSIQSIGNKGLIFLGTDYELYVVGEGSVDPLPPRVNDILQNELHKALVGQCRSCVVSDREEYNLFYPTSASGNFRRIQYNYRTGEFALSEYLSHAWDAVQTVRWTSDDAQTIIGAANTITYELDTTAKDDEITATTTQEVNRFYDTDWLKYATTVRGKIIQSAAWFTGITLVLKANVYTKIAVSVAIDKRNVFRFRKVYDLKPIHRTDEFIAIRYDVPPIYGEWFNIRVEFYPSTAVNPTLQAGFLHFVGIENKKDLSRAPGLTES